MKLHRQCYCLLMHTENLFSVGSHKARMQILREVIHNVEWSRKSYDKRTKGQGPTTAHSSLSTQISKQHRPEKTLKVNIIYYLRETCKLIMSLSVSSPFCPSLQDMSVPAFMYFYILPTPNLKTYLKQNHETFIFYTSPIFRQLYNSL